MTTVKTSSSKRVTSLQPPKILSWEEKRGSLDAPFSTQSSKIALSSLSNKGVSWNHATEDKRQGCICVRLHKVASQENNFYNRGRHSQPNEFATLSSFKSSRTVTHKRVPLPVLSVSSLQNKVEHKKPVLRSLNIFREIAQKERTCSLKQSIKRLLTGRQRFKEGFKDNLERAHFKNKNNYFESKDSQNKVLPQTVQRGFVLESALTQTQRKQFNHEVITKASKSVWKGFSNTFMRNGAKLRYQNLLRKALVVL